MAPIGLYSHAVPDILLHDLVEDLSTSWRMLGRRLGLAEGVLKNIDSEHRRVIEKGVAMFDEWKNRKTTDATMLTLRDGLEKIGRRDLSEKVRGTQDLTLLCSALLICVYNISPPHSSRKEQRDSYFFSGIKST